jgi:hypothetical protein
MTCSFIIQNLTGLTEFVRGAKEVIKTCQVSFTTPENKKATGGEPVAVNSRKILSQKRSIRRRHPTTTFVAK